MCGRARNREFEYAFPKRRYEEQRPVIGRIHEISTGALLAATIAIGPAMGQAVSPWIDPPAAGQAGSNAAPSAPGQPSPSPADAARPPREAAPLAESDVAAQPPPPGAEPPREQVARQLAVDYLDFWSAPNSLTLEVMPDFYGSTVEFHGRAMSASALMEEKRRFVRRWPVRSYSARIDTLRASCSLSGPICTVRGVFDFTAISPERGRRSQGTADLELQISFAGDRPIIIAETSRVSARGRTQAAIFDQVED
jgi:hypothetical protein